MNKKIKIKYILLDKLKFNKKAIRLKDRTDEFSIVDYLFQSNSILSLLLSIGENGYFDTEPLIVVKTKKKYKVIDGNLRLASLKVLSNPLKLNVYKNKLKQILEETSYRPNKIPCIVINNKSDFNIQLGYKHISSFNRWDVSIKRHYIDMFNEKLSDENIEKNSRTIAKTIGSKSMYVMKYIIIAELIKKIKINNEYSSAPIALNALVVSKLFDILSFENINHFLGIRLSNNPLEKLNYHNLEALIKMISSISTDNNFFDKLNDSLENSYFASQLSNGIFFQDDLKSSKDNFHFLEKIENIVGYLSSLNTTDILNFTDKELNYLNKLNEKTSNIISVRLHLNKKTIIS